MANYSDYPEYRSAAQAAQALNNKLHGVPESLSTGLAGELADLRNDPKYGPHSARYKSLKADYDAAQVQLTAAQDKLSKLKTQIDNDNKTASTAKTAIKDINASKAEVTTLTEQLAQQKETNALPDVIAATQLKLQQAQNAAAGIKLPTDPGIGTNVDGTTKTGDQLIDNFKSYLDPADGVSKVSGTGKDAQGNPIAGEFFLVPPSKPGDKPTMINDINKAMDLMVAGAGGTDKLAAALTNAGYKGSFRSNLASALRRYSSDTLDAYQNSKGKLAITGVDSFFKELSTTGAGTSKTRVDQVFTDRAGADRYVNTYFSDTIGRAPTKAEKDDFYKQLNKLESTAKTATTTVTDASGTAKNLTAVGSSITDADRTVLAASIAAKALGNTPVDALMNSAKPGKIVADINTLMSSAADYGITMTPQQALKRLATGLGQTDYVAKQKDVLKQLAITTMPNLAAHIQAGGTVKDVADTYANIKAKKLGITIPDSTGDSQIMSAINQKDGILDTATFERQLQADPRWRNTAEAHNVAADFANTILTSFGFGGN
jgi:HAMP domain-containing protein